MRKLLLASTALVGAFTLIDRADAQQLTTDSPFTVRIDGFATFDGYIVSQSNPTPVLASSANAFRANAKLQQPNGGRSDSFRPDTEIHITATAKADNGLVYGMYVEIEADPNNNFTTNGTVNGGAVTGTLLGVSTHATTPTDEANLFLQGTWGRFEAGDQDGAGDQLFFGPPRDYGPAWGSNSGADSAVMQRAMSGLGVRVGTGVATGAPLYSFNIQALDSSDATKITYLTPVIAGFRAGVSFAPDGIAGVQPAIGCAGASNLCSTTASSLTLAQINPGNLATAALPGTTAPATLATLGRASLPGAFGGYADYQHWIEAGAQWRGTFGDVGLGAMVEYTHASHKKSVFSPAGGALITGVGLTSGLNSGLPQGPYNFVDINSFAVGGQVSWMGLTVGGSFADHFRSTYLTGPFLNSGADAYAYTAGIQYAIGPWVVGYNYAFTFDAGGTTSPWACSFGETGLTAAGGANTAALVGTANSRPCQGSDTEIHSIGAKYILAPGLSAYVEYVNATVVVNGVTVNTGDVGVAGIAVRF